MNKSRCPLCGKKPTMANKRKLLRGHYNIVNRYKKLPNLQWSVVDGKRTKICTTCIKTQGKPVRIKKTKSTETAKTA